MIEFPALFRTLIEVGYKGQLGLEYETEPNNRLPGMIESMAYMRGVLACGSPIFRSVQITLPTPRGLNEVSALRGR